MPAKDETIWSLKVCVPAPGVLFVIEPSDWPGRMMVEVEVVDDMIVRVVGCEL